MAFKATRPGAWLREDIADILTALSREVQQTAKDQGDSDYLKGKATALFDTATALGLCWVWTAEERARYGIVTPQSQS